MLVGILAVYGLTGTFDLRRDEGSRRFRCAVSLLLLVGMLSKSATLPFQTWLPDAGVAPSPVTALLHAAVLVKIGVYVFARLFLATFAFDEALRTVVAAIAGASALVSAGAALIDTDFKRIVAYSTVSQIGFIFLGLATGTPLGAAGALLYILMHGLAKAGLFLSAGHRRAERGHEGHHEARRARPHHALDRGGVSPLRLLGHGNPAVRRVLQQVPGRLGGGLERARSRSPSCSSWARS